MPPWTSSCCSSCATAGRPAAAERKVGLGPAGVRGAGRRRGGPAGAPAGPVAAYVGDPPRAQPTRARAMSPSSGTRGTPSPRGSTGRPGKILADVGHQRAGRASGAQPDRAAADPRLRPPAGPPVRDVLAERAGGGGQQERGRAAADAPAQRRSAAGPGLADQGSRRRGPAGRRTRSAERDRRPARAAGGEPADPRPRPPAGLAAADAAHRAVGGPGPRPAMERGPGSAS